MSYLLHYSDPESKALLEERKRLRDLEWLKGQIGEQTYLTSLKIYGYSEKDAKQEFRLLELEKLSARSRLRRT